MTHTFLDIPVIFRLSIEVYFILLIIAVPTFFFWKWLLKKYIKVDSKRRIATWIFTFITTPIIYVPLVLLFVFGLPFEPGRNFNKHEWLTDREGRFQMANDIINSKVLIGKDTTEVKQILGEPSWKENGHTMWTYDMGWGGGWMSSLFHNLNLTVDRQGKVVLVEHVEIKD